MKKIVSVFAMMASLMALSACNTVQGVGRDIERGGQAIERAAR